LDSPIAAVSPYVTAAFGLAGVLIGGLIAGTVSLVVARQAREAAEKAWIRDSRREIYDRFLTNAQKLLIACEASKDGYRNEEAEKTEDALEAAHVDFFEVYGVVQTVAERPVVDAARVYAYRLWELKEGLSSKSVLGPENFDRVAQLIRRGRHDTIDAMRTELGLDGSARPPEGYNPFLGTDLENQYAAANRVRPG
jgi:gas vesicle protein